MPDNLHTLRTYRQSQRILDGISALDLSRGKKIPTPKRQAQATPIVRSAFK
jgi:hypothetical protein